MLGSSLGRSIGLSFGSYLGRQIVLGACRDDADDGALRRTFRPPVPEANLPSAVDLRPWMTKVEDQGALGSCTSNALVGAVEYLAAREHGARVDLSRLFVYFNQRLWDGYVREDVGASVSDGVRVLATLGVPTERSWPYLRGVFAVQPPEPIYAEAARYRITDWWSIPIDAGAMRACLAGGFPIVFGTRVTESFMRVPRSGVVPMPSAHDRDDARHGRHALLLVGYDDSRRHFVVRNSWGDDWGDLGYCYMPYAYVAHPQWSRNAWSLRLAQGEHDPARPPPVDLRTLPAAEPGPASAGGGALGQVAGVGTELAVSMLTGSAMLGGLAGGLLAGVTPGAVQALRGRDGGALVGGDRKDVILAAMRAIPGASGGTRLPWDDGLDERASVAALGDTRSIRAAAAEAPRAPSTPSSSPPVITAAATSIAAPSVPPAVGAPATAPVTAPSLIAVAEAAHAGAGGKSGPLGAVVGAPSEMIEGAYRGVALRCVSGGVFVWSGEGGAQAPIVLYGSEPLYARWLALGAAASPLAWPSDPIETGLDGATRYLPCTRGVVVGHPRRGVHTIAGVLFGLWMDQGGPTGALGAPLDDGAPHDDGLVQRFERGTLWWSPTQGARVTPVG